MNRKLDSVATPPKANARSAMDVLDNLDLTGDRSDGIVCAQCFHFHSTGRFENRKSPGREIRRGQSRTLPRLLFKAINASRCYAFSLAKSPDSVGGQADPVGGRCGD